MSNRINPYQNSLIQSFRHTAQRSEAPVREAETPRLPAAAQSAAAQSAASGVEDLNPVEQQMIDRYFPRSEAMTMRLYGANRGSKMINPGAVGGHLDIRG